MSMNRKAMAKYAALAISYANVNKPENAAYFATLWLQQLGVQAHNMKAATPPDKYKNHAWNDETNEYEEREAQGTVTLIRNGERIG